MDKTYYKELIEKYFEGNITDDEIKELSGWIKNDRRLQDWWENEFSRSDTDINPIPVSKKRHKEKRKKEPFARIIGDGLPLCFYLSVSLFSPTIL